MLKFFRRIWKELFDSGRTSKYLLYAAGEIALVVIGILLALQINNWNEERNNNVLEAGYKLALREDLAKDSSEVRSKIAEMKEELNQLMSMGEKLSALMQFDSITHLYRFKLSPLFNATINFNRNTFETLLATGNINLIEKDLRNRLMILHNFQADPMSWIIDTNVISFFVFKVFRTSCNILFKIEVGLLGSVVTRTIK